MTARQSTWVTHVGGSGRRSVATYRLTVLKGANRGHSVQVETPRFRVGALEGNDLRLDDPSVSGLHLELSHDPQGIRVRDLDSRNGTRVNGVAVVEAFLTEASTLELGATHLRFELGAGSVELPSSTEMSFGPLIGRSAVMRELFARLATFATTDSTVLIHGETGTGKEVVAEAIVQASPRANGPLVVVDCSALAPSLIESELFGHEKGAFTGAVTARPGSFERGAGGTVFLDEIAELPLELQPRLLRALERREVQRLGGRAPVPVDVRILAASHRALESEVNAGRFRADLYYRLSVLRVDVPPLRARPDDIAALVQHFAGPSVQVDEKTMQRFVSHAWPGNVRELRNAVERWRAGADPLSNPLSPPTGTSASLSEPFLVQKERLVNEFERRYAEQLLAACGGNLAEGARVAGVSRMAIVKMVQRLGLM